MILFLGVILLFTGCTVIDDSTSVLWTNRAEIAAYTALFNSIQDQYRIETVYNNHPEIELENSELHPDLIIAENLLNRSTLKYFSPLDEIFEDAEKKREGISKDLFYSELLELCRKNENYLLVPFSFNLPALMYKKGDISDSIENFYLTMENIRSSSLEFSNQDQQESVKLGFSPKWEPEMIYILSVLNGADFHQTSAGDLAWTDTGLSDTLDYIGKWIEEVNAGHQNEVNFTEKYLYDPGYKLLIDERILFYYSDIKNFFTIPANIRKELDFKLIAENNNIPVSGDILYGGIMKNAKSPDAAFQFLKWFFKPETQKLLLDSANFNRMRTFGIADGFSSLSIVNQIDFPVIYPALVGQIPPDRFLEFPNQLPRNWSSLKNEIIIPWMLKKTSPDHGDEDLNEVIEKWILQR